MGDFFNYFFTEYSLDVFLSLLAAFLLGLLLGWIIWGRKARYWRGEYNTLKGNYGKLEGKYAKLEEELQINEAEFQKARVSLNDFKVKNKALEAEKGQLHADLMVAKGEIESGTGSMPEEATWALGALGVSSWGDAKAKLEASDSEKADLQAQIDALNAQLSNSGDAGAKLADCTANSAKLEAEIGRLKAQVSATGTSGELSELQNENELLRAQLNEMNARMEVGATRGNMEAEDAELSASISAAANEVAGESTDMDEESAEEKAAKAQAAIKAALGTTIVAATADNKDDLKRINGVGPFIEQKLNGLGIYTFEQVSQFDDAFVDTVTDAIQFFPGRIQRDNWVGQAKELMGSGPVAAKSAEKINYKKLTVAQYGVLFNADNLQLIEGVGPKSNELLNAAGINTWSDLAGTSTEKLQSILDEAGSNFKMVDPSTWTAQAEMAANNEWEKLVAYQKQLDTGKADKGDGDTPSKVEVLAKSLIGFRNRKDNDLKIVEGIGPKIESLIKDAGIKTWAELAESTPGKLREILDAAGGRYRIHNPSTWPKQAEMARDGKWEELQNYQDYLDGGKDPNTK